MGRAWEVVLALRKKGRYWYGETVEDLRAEVVRYSRANEYEAKRFARPVCRCGGGQFKLFTDEAAGVAARACVACATPILMGDSGEYASGADLERHECVCDGEAFELLSAVALYEGSADVRWYYIGGRCVGCGVVGVLADWKCEGGEAEAFLRKT